MNQLSQRRPKTRNAAPAPGRRSWADAAPDIITTVIGVALVVFALWGFWIAADVARPTPGDPNQIIAAAERNLTVFKFVLTWLVLFAPFLCLGLALLRSTFRKNYGISRIWGLMGTINQVLPFWAAQSRYGRMASQFQGYEMEKPLATIPAAAHESLDEETIRKVDRAGYLTAKALGAIVGGLLAAAGVLGVVLELLETYGAAPVYSPPRLSIAFVTFCMALAAVGFVILRDTLRPEQRAWLGPLRMFSFIVGLRVVADVVKRDYQQQSGARTLPGQEPRKVLGPPSSPGDPEAP